MLKELLYTMHVAHRRQYKNMPKNQPQIALNNIMELNNNDKSASDETCPVWVYGSIVIRDPENQKPIAKIPG